MAKNAIIKLMIKEKYLKEIKDNFKDFKSKNLKIFIFGSSTSKPIFGDIDIGITGKIDERKILDLKEKFEDSNLPYKIDLVHIDKTPKEFQKNILNGNLLWIKH